MERQKFRDKNGLPCSPLITSNTEETRTQLENSEGPFFSACSGTMIVQHQYDHWRQRVTASQKSPEIQLYEISNSAKFWWEDLVRKGPARRIRNIRVGIIDVDLAPSQTTSEILSPAFFSSNLNLDGMHGRLVASVMSKSISGRSGVCQYIDVYGIDVSGEHDSFFPGVSLSAYTTSHQISDAIKLLYKSNLVDLINLSVGYQTEEDPVVQDAIKGAERNGVLVLAPTGNSGGIRPDMPACLSEVVGVAGVGKSGIAPAGTENEFRSQHARFRGSLAQDNHGEMLFIDPAACLGDQANVAAPSIGVVLTLNTKCTIDLYGTSFACPIVTAALAAELDSNDEYLGADKKDRAEIARGVLDNICVDVDWGDGAPRLPIPRIV